jgi:transcriptional regulator with XRE-family HTH domain
MDDLRVGRLLRAVRQQLELRQIDVARKAGVSQKVVSQLELGRLETVGLAKLRRVAAVLGVSVFVDARWRGGESDRLLDRAHAAIVDEMIARLRRAGWAVEPEFTFNHYGDRGSVDVLAFHAPSRSLLVVEVKATLTDIQALLSALSKKMRVVPALAQEALGWDVGSVGRLLVVAESKANRAVVARHRATFEAALPERSRACQTWISRPRGRLAGIWFVANSAVATGTARPRARVRRRKRERVGFQGSQHC